MMVELLLAANKKLQNVPLPPNGSLWLTFGAMPERTKPIKYQFYLVCAKIMHIIAIE